MAKIVLTDAYIYINGATDISSDVSALTLNADIEEVDGTCFSTGYRDFDAGLENATLSMTLKHPTDMSTLDGVIWPLRGTKIAFLIRPTSDAVGTDNPQYSGTVLVAGSYGLGGSVGGSMDTSITWKVCSVVTRATM